MSHHVTTTLRDLRELGRTHRTQLARWVADTGLAMVGMVGLFSAPGLVFGWNHHLHLGMPAGQGGVLAAAELAVCVIAVLTWLTFALHYTTATRIGAVALGSAGLVVTVTVTLAPNPATTADHADPVVAGLALVTLLGFCPAIHQSAPTPSRRDTRAQSRPKLSWPIALPLYLLAYALAFTGLDLSLNSHDSVFVGAGDPRSVINYAIAMLGFAVVGTLRSRAPSAYAAAAATTLCLPLALSGLLLPTPADQPVTGPVLDLVLAVVLIPTLLWLAHHRATTTPLLTAPSGVSEACA